LADEVSDATNATSGNVKTIPGGLTIPKNPAKRLQELHAEQLRRTPGGPAEDTQDRTPPQMEQTVEAEPAVPSPLASVPPTIAEGTGEATPSVLTGLRETVGTVDRTDGRTGGRKHGRTDGRKDGRADGSTAGRAYARPDV